jgi:hypothetical protein
MAVLHPKDPKTPPNSPIRLRPKEIDNASEDGFTIAVRPRPNGGFWVHIVNVETQKSIWWPLIAEERSDVPAAITELMRDMNKFLNLGGEMAQAGRHRNKRLAALRAELRRVDASLKQAAPDREYFRERIEKRVKSLLEASQNETPTTPGYMGWSVDGLRKLINRVVAERAIKSLKAFQSAHQVLIDSLREALKELK